MPIGVPHNLSGQVFGRLKVLGPDAKSAGRRKWICICDCGRSSAVRGDLLVSGRTQSCGCLGLESKLLNGKGALRHGLCNTSVYKAWASMKERCFNRGNRNYPNYGARGITICTEWMDFLPFHAYVSALPHFGKPGRSLDRYPNNNGNYEPGNVRWATSSEQRKNQRSKAEISISKVVHHAL